MIKSAAIFIAPLLKKGGGQFRAESWGQFRAESRGQFGAELPVLCFREILWYTLSEKMRTIACGEKRN